MKFDNYQIRLITKDDIEAYYRFGFEESDEAADYFTGTTETFTKDQIAAHVNKIITDPTRCDFLILEEDEIVGEVVLNEIQNHNCHFRICLFNSRNFSKKIGYNSTVMVLDYAFTTLNMETVELEVFPFNERGIGLYRKLGFREIDKIIDEEASDPYRDVILMRLRSSDFYKHAL